jgi:hypothetical protein
MNPPHRLALAAAAVALAAIALLAPAAQAAPKPPTVPPAIAVPAGHTLFKVGHAGGVQIYACNGTAWTFVAPRANLYKDNGKFYASHFAGPTWMTKDGSSVVAAAVANSPVAGTIPWLLLQARSTTPGKLERTTYIQRVNTTGGVAPAAATCNATTAGTQSEIPYTADYYFWRAK